MIEHELALLGLLKEGPKHGYDIKKKIREILCLFAGIDFKSVYYPLRILEKKGLIEKNTTRQGRRPTRFVYCLTPKGENRFQELVNKSLLSFKRPQFSLDLTLYFLNYIEPDIAKRRLRARLLILNKLNRELRESTHSLRNKGSTALARILEHNSKMVEAESRFLKNLIRNI